MAKEASGGTRNGSDMPGDTPLLPWEQGAEAPDLLGFAEDTDEEESTDDPTSDTPEGGDGEGDGTPDDGTGDEDLEDDDAPEDEDAEEEEYLVEVDGEQLTLEELRKGYLRNADYTRKQQVRAEAERAAREEAAEAQRVRETYGSRLVEIEAYLKQGEGEEPDWDALKAKSPADFARRYAEWDLQQRHLTTVRAERERVGAEAQRHYDSLRREHLEGEREKLLAKLPEWGDPEKGATEKERLGAYLMSPEYGFRKEDLDSVSDHRLLVLSKKAMLYDELHAKGAGKLGSTVKKGRVLKPGSPPRSDPRKGATRQTKLARERLARSGSVRDAAALFEGLIGDDF